MIVPPLGIRYSKDAGPGLPLAGVGGGDDEEKEEEGGGGGGGDGASTETATTTGGTAGTSSMSLYSTVMTHKMVAKTLAQRREEIIGSFNSVSKC